MNNAKYVLTFAILAGVLLLGGTAAFAQAKVDPSYQVALQLLVGTNDSAVRGADVPAAMANVARDLKAAYPFSNYRLTNTYLGRVGEAGNFEFKSVANLLGQDTPAANQTFLEWSILNLKNMPNDRGGAGYSASGFRFGARVPVITSSRPDPSGKTESIVNYEAIGLNLNKVGFSENVPTLVGSLTLPGTNGTAFLVVTVKATDR